MNLACQPDIHVLIHSTEPVWKINRRPIDGIDGIENLTSRSKNNNRQTCLWNKRSLSLNTLLKTF